MSEQKSPPGGSAEAGAGRIAGPELEIKDAPLIFEQVWKQLVQERGLEGMPFPKEIMWLGVEHTFTIHFHPPEIRRGL